VRAGARAGARVGALALAAGLLGGVLHAQDIGLPSARAVPRSLETAVPLAFAAFSDRVMANHPIAVQARQVEAAARAELTMARGAFDPKLEFARDRKVFGGTEYFDYVDAALKIPTFIGSDLKLAFERTSGRFFQTDRLTPAQGLLTLGLTVPLGQRLLTDERRTALTQAQALRDAGEAERVAMLNKLVASAAKDYAGWYEAWQRLLIAQEGVELARFRLDAVRQRVAAGDSPPVDSLEASLEVRRREVSLGETQATYFAARQLAESYLWTAQGMPEPIDEREVPVLDGIAFVAPDSLLVAQAQAEVERFHPEVRKAEATLRSVQAERFLAAQGVLPFAEASLSSLSGRDERGALTDRDAWSDNQKVGFYASSPLLFLKERGKLGLTGAKLEAARAERDFTRRLVGLALDVAAYDLVQLASLRGLQERNVEQATQLRDAEQIRFLNGESTLLIVNLRERLVLDELVKRASVEAKGIAAVAALGVALGDVGRVGSLFR
jgi:outer membrane protein TolC